MSSITIRHDLRGQFGPARDQGGRETCLAFAVSDAHAAAIGKPWSPLCCEYLFYHAKQHDKTPVHQGTTASAIRAALEVEGQPIEKAWPYLTTIPSDLAMWKPPAKVGQLFFRKSKGTGTAFDLAWAAIEADQSTVIGMSLSGAFYMPDSDGVVDSNEAENPSVKHAVLVVANGTRGKKRLVLVRNSWGETWGLSGYAWLCEGYITPRIKVTLAVE